MRTRIIDSLFTAMREHEDIFFLTADMGINLVERFAQAYPDRFLNVGIAEQNLIGVAAGLANAGFRPFVYTISNFLVHRAFEQIRIDVALHRYPITLLGTSSGFDNAPLGPTHHILDEWGSLRAIPGIDIYCPASTTYAAGLVPLQLARNNPAYVRIPKGSFDHPALGAGDTIYLPKRDATSLLVAYGATVPACLAVHESKAPASLLVLNRLRPLEDLRLPLSSHRRVLVVEDHFAHAGLYSLLCQYANEQSLPCRLHTAAPDTYNLHTGATERFYHSMYRMDEPSLTAFINA